MLQKNGIAAQRLAALAFAEHRPLASNETEEGRKKNRRVVLRIGQFAAENSVDNNTASQIDVLQGKQNLDQDSPAESSSTKKLGESGIAEKEAIQGSDQGLAQSQDQQIIETSNELAPREGRIQPVRLKGGNLLFSSDPDLPRLQSLQREEE